jgi:hypothetical protein
MHFLSRARPLVLAAALAGSTSLIGAGAASANVPIVNATIACDSQGQQVITWSVTNSETTVATGGNGDTMKITAFTETNPDGTHGTVSGLFVGEVVQPQPLAGSTVTGTTTLPGNVTGEATLDVTGEFFNPDGSSAGSFTNSGAIFWNTTCAPTQTQTIAGHIYDCTSGTPTTTEVAGGTLGASGPQSVATQPNPLNPTQVAAGTYTMSASSPSGYQFVLCGGSATITSPSAASESVIVPAGGAGVGIFYVARPSTPTAQFAPTQTTCQQFAAGTATTENTLTYKLKNGVINNVAPGVLFYYTEVTAPAAGGTFTVTVSQTDNGSTPAFGAMQLMTYTANCNTYGNVSASTSANGTSTFIINGAAANQIFILSVKVDPHTVVGAATPSPSTVTYTYTTAVNGVAIPTSVQQALLQP